MFSVNKPTICNNIHSCQKNHYMCHSGVGLHSSGWNRTWAKYAFEPLCLENLSCLATIGFQIGARMAANWHIQLHEIHLETIFAWGDAMKTRPNAYFQFQNKVSCQLPNQVGYGKNWFTAKFPSGWCFVSWVCYQKPIPPFGYGDRWLQNNHPHGLGIWRLAVMFDHSLQDKVPPYQL